MGKFFPRINEGRTTVQDILNDGWKPTGQRIKFLSPDGTMVLFFNPQSGECVTEKVMQLKVKK